MQVHELYIDFVVVSLHSRERWRVAKISSN